MRRDLPPIKAIENIKNLIENFDDLKVYRDSENEFGVYISNETSYICLCFNEKSEIDQLVNLSKEDLKKKIKAFLKQINNYGTIL